MTTRAMAPLLAGLAGLALFALTHDMPAGARTVAAPSAAQPGAPLAATTPPPTTQTFPQTGQTVSGAFLAYWQGHGGLAQQGYPISGEFQEKSDLNGQTYTVQYFERAVFEKHPENKPPYDVLLSQLGTTRYKAKYPTGAPGQHASVENAITFKETGHTLGGRFRTYWEGHGGLAQQGFPISDEFAERSDLNGQTYLVQYFERAVFEYHPENQPPFDILLSQLGTFQYQQKYPKGSGASGAVLDLVDQCLLGGVANGRWITDTVASTLKGGETYRLYSLTAALGQTTGSAPESMGVPCEDEQQVTLTATPAAATLAVTGNWNPQPRLPKAESTSQDVYIQAASTVLRGKGIANPQVHLTQVLRADLDGDGESEVLVTATYHKDGLVPHAEVGEYSVVFLRKVVKGQVQTVILDGDFILKPVEFGAPLTFTVTGLLDLNGDGTLEIAVRSEYYEGAGTTIYEVTGTQVKDVLSCGCGA